VSLAKKRLLAGAGGASLLALLIALTLRPPGSRASQGAAAKGTERDPEPACEPLKLLSRCKAFSDCDSEALDWAKARRYCSEALQCDPALWEARELEKRSLQEIELQELIRKAKLKAATSQDDAALELLAEVEKTSCSFAEAWWEFKEVAGRIEKRSRTSCKTDFKAGLYSQATSSCRRFLEVTCSRPPPDFREMERLFLQSGKRSGSAGSFECPSRYRPFLGYAPGQNLEVELSQIRALYPEVEMGCDPAGPMMRYFAGGRPRQSADELKRLRSKCRASTNQLEELIGSLELIEGRAASGQEGILRGQPLQVLALWRDAFEADARLMPPGIRSQTRREMSSQLAVAFLKSGLMEVQKQRYREAFRLIHQAYALDPANPDIVDQISGMERAARQGLNEPSCESIQFALDITIPADPARPSQKGSEIHKRAARMKEERGCP
jgi:tetratricopeptide (TPR) repeat protein